MIMRIIRDYNSNLMALHSRPPNPDGIVGVHSKKILDGQMKINSIN